MPNGHDYTREYGGHNYPRSDGTSDCSYGCGCWMGPARSNGPLGVDPHGECPANPRDGLKGLKLSHDIEVVVTRRIRSLESRANTAEQKLKETEPEKIILAATIKRLTDENNRLRDIKRNVLKALDL